MREGLRGAHFWVKIKFFPKSPVAPQREIFNVWGGPTPPTGNLALCSAREGRVCFDMVFLEENRGKPRAAPISQASSDTSDFLEEIPSVATKEPTYRLPLSRLIRGHPGRVCMVRGTASQEPAPAPSRPGAPASKRAGSRGLFGCSYNDTVYCHPVSPIHLNLLPYGLP